MAVTPNRKTALGTTNVRCFGTKAQNDIIDSHETAINNLIDGSISTTDLTLAGTLTIAGAITSSNTTQSTNKDTGAIVTEGGLGVEKNANIGGALGVTGKTVVAPGTVGDPGIVIGANDNGLYEVSSSQLGVSVGNALATLFDASGIKSDSIRPRVALGSTPGGINTISAVEYGDGRDITTVITLTNCIIGAPTAGASEAIGELIYTFPAGAHLHEVSYMSVGLTIGGVTTDTPDVGIGSVIATGAVAVLGGTATFEDYITGQTAADCAGTATVKTSVATAGALTGISINEAGSAKTVHLNVADAWDAGVTGNLTASGTVTLKWTKLSA